MNFLHLHESNIDDIFFVISDFSVTSSASFLMIFTTTGHHYYYYRQYLYMHSHMAQVTSSSIYTFKSWPNCFNKMSLNIGDSYIFNSQCQWMKENHHATNSNCPLVTYWRSYLFFTKRLFNLHGIRRDGLLIFSPPTAL